MQAIVPGWVAHVAVASPHGNGSVAAVTAIATGPASVAPSPSGGSSASVFGNVNVSRGSPKLTSAARTRVPVLQTVGVAPQAAVLIVPQSDATTTRRVGPFAGLNATV